MLSCVVILYLAFYGGRLVRYEQSGVLHFGGNNLRNALDQYSTLMGNRIQRIERYDLRARRLRRPEVPEIAFITHRF